MTQQDRRDWAVRDYKRQMKVQKRWSATTVNQALAAIDNFYRSRQMGRPDVAREQIPQVAPRALDETDQRKLIRAVERLPSVRDRAIVTVMLYTGLRLSELAALVVTDVAITARKGMVTVRSGKGDRYRKVPLNSACRPNARGLVGCAGGSLRSKRDRCRCVVALASRYLLVGSGCRPCHRTDRG